MCPDQCTCSPRYLPEFAHICGCHFFVALLFGLTFLTYMFFLILLTYFKKYVTPYRTFKNCNAERRPWTQECWRCFFVSLSLRTTEFSFLLASVQSRIEHNVARSLFCLSHSSNAARPSRGLDIYNKKILPPLKKMIIFMYIGFYKIFVEVWEVISVGEVISREQLKLENWDAV
jgi:hypothetical protein